MRMEKELENFIKWARLKAEMHNKEKKIYFKNREIWWARLGINIGYETDGKNENFERPILILKTFNKYTLWALPLTTKEKIGKYYYQFEYMNIKYSVILSQLKLISSKRLLRKVRTLENNHFGEIRKLIKNLI